MLRLRSRVTATALSVMGVLACASPAFADGNVVCSELTGTCTMVAEDGGSSGDKPSPQRDQDPQEASVVSECDRWAAKAADRTCVAPETLGGEGPSPAEVAQRAIEDLALTAPEAHLAPKPSGMGLVGLPVWMWVPEEDWTTVTETASAGSVTVTATAEPSSVVWRMGDGSRVVCRGPGTPYTPDAGSTSSPDCGHTYTQTSAEQSEQRYRVTATVRWEITWSGGGTSGTDEIERTSATSVRIGEAQSLVQ